MPPDSALQPATRHSQSLSTYDTQKHSDSYVHDPLRFDEWMCRPWLE